MKSVNWQYYYIFTLIFFALGFFNIIFGWLGLACMILPFILLFKDKKKSWCQHYCPRASLFSKLFKNRSSFGQKGIEWLIKGKVKWLVLGYFAFNLFVLTMSTIMVSKGRIMPIEEIRFLMAFKIPFDLPQILFGNIGADWAIHLSFRLYSMMFTTTVIGLVLGWLFKPRTWCAICPINTVSTLVLNKAK